MAMRAPHDAGHILTPTWSEDAAQLAEKQRRVAWEALTIAYETYGPHSPQYSEAWAQWLQAWHTWRVAWSAAWQTQINTVHDIDAR
jgi:hypothetical protein